MYSTHGNEVSSYDGADGSLAQDLMEAKWRYEELNDQITELEELGEDTSDLTDELAVLDMFLYTHGMI